MLGPASCAREAAQQTRHRVASGPAIRRVFRADAPQETAIASLLAATLQPGRDVLALYAGMSYGLAPDSIRASRALAAAHDWTAVVDLTDIPIPVPSAAPGVAERAANLRATVVAVREIRRRIGAAMGPVPGRPGTVDELYLTVPRGATMAPALAAFPEASVIRYPHTFASMFPYEIAAHVSEYPAGALGQAADLVKRVVWGTEALPTRRLVIDRAVTFGEEAPWAAENLSVPELISAAAMRRLFSLLPGNIGDDLRGLAERCRPETGLLLLTSGDPMGVEGQHEIEQAGYERVVAHLRERHGVRDLLVKPHPRSSPARVAEVTDALVRRFADVRVMNFDRHPAVPIEVAVVPFVLRACGGLISTGQFNLRQIFGLPSYYPREEVLALYPDSATVPGLIGDWHDRLPGAVEAI